MSDVGHELTDGMLARLEERIRREYARATRDATIKLERYLDKIEEGRKKQEELLKAGVITRKDYNDWVYRHTMIGDRWEAMRDTLAADLHNANAVAMGMIKGEMPDVYALNMNYGTYDIEHGGRIDTGFTLYNHDTAEYLLGDERQLMPGPSTKKAAEIAANKDLQWNKQHIQSAVLQGVLQGESMHEVAARLRQVGQMDYNASVRYARTMTTSAQNAGRYNAFRRAAGIGVDLTIEWQATLDMRTRHDHRMMHGQRRAVNEPFVTPEGFSILYPADCTGDSDAPQKEIWNCRCTLLSWVKGFEGDTVKESPKMGDMSFEEWQQAKKPKENSRGAFVSSPEVSSRGVAGRPSAVIGGAKLNARQINLLKDLISDGDFVTVGKKSVSLRDIAALTAHEGVEFALLTRRNERMVIRGSERHVRSISVAQARAYRAAGWKWSGHTHAIGGLIPSYGDLSVLKAFGQKRSVIYDASGKFLMIEGRE